MSTITNNDNTVKTENAGAESGTPHSPLPTPHSPPPSSRRKPHRSSTISQLPHKVREQINEMLRDGMSYMDIACNLDQMGYDVSPHHVGYWARHDFVKWLQEQVQFEKTSGLLSATQYMLGRVYTDDNATTHFVDACELVLATHLAQTIQALDPQTIKNAIANDPEQLFKFVQVVRSFLDEHSNRRKVSLKFLKHSAAVDQFECKRQDEQDHRYEHTARMAAVYESFRDEAKAKEAAKASANVAPLDIDPEL